MSLKEQAVLVQWSCSMPSGTKRDKEITNRVAHGIHGSGQNGKKMGNYNKIIVHNDYLRPFRTVRSGIEDHIREWTVPWLTDLDLLPSKHIMDFSKFFRDEKSRWDAKIQWLSEKYPDEVQEEAKKRLMSADGSQSAFRDDDYLDRDSFLARFSLGMRFIPVSDADDLDIRVHVGEVQEDLIRKFVRADMEKELLDTHKELCMRIKKHVTHMRDIVSKDSKIFDTMVQGVSRLAETIPALNFTGDPMLDDIAQDIHNELTVDSNVLRNSESVKNRVQTKADEILRKLGKINVT